MIEFVQAEELVEGDVIVSEIQGQPVRLRVVQIDRKPKTVNLRLALISDFQTTLQRVPNNAEVERQVQVPWEDADLTSPEEIERNTHSVEKSRRLKEEARG